MKKKKPQLEKKVDNSIFQQSSISIFEKQKEEKFVNLHLAKDWYYLQSETAWRIGFWASLGYAIILLVIYFLRLDFMTPPIEITANLVGLFFAGLLKYRADKMKKTGAIIQEELDTSLFGISWNEILVPEGTVNPDFIIQAAPKSKKDKKRFETWYSKGTSKNEAHHSQVLRCQRENISFDFMLRRKYTARFFWILTVFAAVAIVYGLLGQLTVGNWLLNIAFPLSGFLMIVGRTWIENRQIIKQQETMEQKIRKKIMLLSKEETIIDDFDLREIQDFIYENRSSRAVSIPDSYYEKYRDKLDEYIIRGTNMIEK